MTARSQLEVRVVRNGRGIVALRRFARGEVVGEIKGKIVTSDQVWKYWKRDPKLAENCFRYDAERYLSPAGEIGAFANHSCHPNAGVIKVRGRLYLKAIKPITPNTEVTHDYSTLLGRDDIWTMPCNCGEAECRGKVSGFHLLPTALIARYIRLGVIPEFMRATLTP
ncbi:MAG: SET domain-containing protein [Phycisphaerales bacterium]|nr:SET domain-containing protein [Phycisphaerales bacterium]